MLEKNELNLIWVEPSRLRPNEWNTNQVSPENEKKLDESLDKFNVFKPILARELDNGELEIIGGEHRCSSALRKGIPMVPVVNLGKIDTIRAKEMSLIDNGRYGSDNVFDLAALLKEIEVTDSHFAYLMPFSEQEMNDILEAGKIDLETLTMPDEEEEEEPSEEPAAKPAPTQQIIRFKVSNEDAELISEIIEDIMEKNGYDKADALTNAGDALMHLVSNME